MKAESNNLILDGVVLDKGADVVMFSGWERLKCYCRFYCGH